MYFVFQIINIYISCLQEEVSWGVWCWKCRSERWARGRLWEWHWRWFYLINGWNQPRLVSRISPDTSQRQLNCFCCPWSLPWCLWMIQYKLHFLIEVPFSMDKISWWPCPFKIKASSLLIMIMVYKLFSFNELCLWWADFNSLLVSTENRVVRAHKPCHKTVSYHDSRMASAATLLDVINDLERAHLAFQKREKELKQERDMQWSKNQSEVLRILNVNRPSKVC